MWHKKENTMIISAKVAVIKTHTHETGGRIFYQISIL